MTGTAPERRWRIPVAAPLSVVTGTGWAVLAVAGIALAVGLGYDWIELTYLGLTMLAAALVAVAFLVGRTTYEVTIALEPSRVVVGQRAMGRLAVRNAGRRAVLPSVVELPVGTGVAEFSVPLLRPDAEHDELFAVPTHRRAVVVAGPAASVRGAARGLLRRTVRWTEPEDLFVHPVTTQLTPSAAGLVRDLEGQVTNKITNNDIAFHALREYVTGDDRRYIHWRTSARTGQLMVRQFEETRRSQLTVLHTENEEYYASPEEFELAVSVTASIASQVIRDGTQIAVVSDTRRLRTHSPTALLDDSCRLDLTAPRHEGARELARAATRRLPPPSVLIVVTGSAMSVADLRAIDMLFPSDTTTLALQIDLGASPSLRPVSRLRVATIGALGDLPMVMRRVAA